MTLTPGSAPPENTRGIRPFLTKASLSADVAHVLDTSEDGVIFLDRQWRIVYANRNARRLSHIRDEYINGKSHWEIYPDTIGTELERQYRRVMQSRVEGRYCFHYEPFDLTTDIRILPIEAGIALIYRDLTAQRREEAARLSIAQQLEQVLEATTDAVLYLDRDYRLNFLNRRARELLSPSGDVLGAILWEAFPATGQKDSLYFRNYRWTMEEGQPTEFESYYPEPLNRWYSSHCVPAKDGMILFLRDITDERNDKEALALKQQEAERQRAEIESVYRTAPVGLALFDPVEFRYVRMSDHEAGFYGMPPEQVLGRPVTELAPIPGLRELFEQVARGQTVRDYLLEGELATRPGEHRYWTVNYHPVYASDGTVQAISAVSQEITRQKQAEAALIQSEKLAAVGRLATSISHEINNPLEAITNLLYLIATHDGLPASVSEWVETAQAELARVSQIATQTLRFHRQSLKPTLCSAKSLVGGVIDLYQGRLTNSGIEVLLKYRSHTPVLCLENDIRQVLNNLIANAIDAMREGGRLLVRSHDATNAVTGARGVRIIIADTGHGMSAQTKERIFEPFYTTKDLNGTGLGLWISAEIVARHRGRIRVRSSQHQVRHGTIFSLFLPLEAELEEMVRREAGEPRDCSSSGQP